MAIFESPPDYKAMYPNASDEVIECLRKGHRKEQYADYDRKVERCKIDMDTGTVTYIKSREDSLNRLMDEDVPFSDEAEHVEDEVIKAIMIDKLLAAAPPGDVTE